MRLLPPPGWENTQGSGSYEAQADVQTEQTVVPSGAGEGQEGLRARD